MKARGWAILLALLSAAAMLYVGLYQSRAVNRLWCPLFNKGCEAVADAPFARPFGIPDGYIAAGMYAVFLLLLLLPRGTFAAWVALLVLAVLAAVANILGVRDMMNLGSYCFYCMLTTVASPRLVWAVWKLRPAKEPM